MKTAFTPQDLYLHKKVMEIACSPDGSNVVCSVRTVDRENDGYRQTIWQVSPDGGVAVERLGSSGASATHPAWSADGLALAFLSNQGGSEQIHTLSWHSGEQKQVGDFAGGVTDFAWSPDGKAMAVTSAVPVDASLCGRRGPAPTSNQACVPEVAWKLPYKSDDAGYLLGREIHLFWLDIASGEQRRLTDGCFDVLGMAISPDSRQIAYARTREGRFAHRSELWSCDAGGRHHRPLVQHVATVANPVWSPDGAWIVFTGGQEEGQGEATLWLHEIGSGNTTTFCGSDLEIAAGSVAVWSEDSSAIVFCQAHRGRHRLVRGSLQDRSLQVLVAGERQFGAFALCGENLLFSVHCMTLPSDIWLCRPGMETERRLSDFNPWWRDRTDLIATLECFDVPDGRGGSETIEGWLMRAAGSEGAGPLLDDVHGGPAAYALLDYDSNVYWQALCSQGWRILALNAVGSSSYGNAFCARLTGHWGEHDLPQHLAAVRSLQQRGICDQRVAIAGKSYGGFFTSWTIGHTDHFGAAVVMAPIANIESHYGTSDGGYYADPFYQGKTPAFDLQLARKLSPVQYVQRSSTPTLIMHGKDDERCPKSQSEELFVRLMRAGETPAELVLYPGENHGFLGQGKPACRVDAATRIMDWITLYTARASPASPSRD